MDIETGGDYRNFYGEINVKMTVDMFLQDLIETVYKKQLDHFLCLDMSQKEGYLRVVKMNVLIDSNFQVTNEPSCCLRVNTRRPWSGIKEVVRVNFVTTMMTLTVLTEGKINWGLVWVVSKEKNHRMRPVVEKNKGGKDFSRSYLNWTTFGWNIDLRLRHLGSGNVMKDNIRLSYLRVKIMGTRVKVSKKIQTDISVIVEKLSYYL